MLFLCIFVMDWLITSHPNGNKVTEVLQHSQYLHFSVLIVAHAEDQFVEKEELDKATEGYLVQNVKDIKQAQVRFCLKDT